MSHKAQSERYSRFLALRDVTNEDLELILGSTVTVVGAGGLGSPILRLVTAYGFGTIRIIDHDVVDLSNLQRQTIFDTDDIGNPKAITAANNLSRLNPDVTFEPYPVSLREDNAIELLSGSDVILDGLDSILARRALNKASQSLKIPYVYAGAIEYYGNISTFVPDSTGCLHCLIGDLADESVMTCADVGVLPTLLSIIGAMEVQEAIQIVTNRTPHFANHLMHVDIQTMSFDRFNLERNPTCPVCSTSSKPPSKSKKPFITLLCSGSYSISPVDLLKVNFEDITSQLKPSYQYTSHKAFLRIHLESDITITIMNTGSAVIKGVFSEEKALDIYNEIMT